MEQLNRTNLSYMWEGSTKVGDRNFKLSFVIQEHHKITFKIPPVLQEWNFMVVFSAYISLKVWNFFSESGGRLFQHLPFHPYNVFPDTTRNPPVLSTDDATSQVQFTVLGPSLKEGHWDAGANTEKGNEDGKGFEAKVLWGAAEGAELIYPGEKKAQCWLCPHLQLPERML